MLHNLRLSEATTADFKSKCSLFSRSAQSFVVIEPAVCVIVCTAILKGFEGESTRQKEFADVDISPGIDEELEGQASQKRLQEKNSCSLI